MRVLHVWSVTGIAAMLAHFGGPRHKVVMSARFDPYNQSSIYDPAYLTRAPGIMDAPWFYLVLLRRSIGADLLHIHGQISMAKKLRHLHKPYIQHYHGRDVLHVSPKCRKQVEQGATRILVSTPNLLSYEYAQTPQWLPNPVDTNLFSRRRIPQNNKGLVHLISKQDRDMTLQRLNEFGYGDVEWDFIYRGNEPGVRHMKVSYADMPAHLAQYEYYGAPVHDWRTNVWLQADSKTGLEAMALGLKVIRYDGSVRDTLPPEHRVENVVAKLHDIYDAI